MDYTQNGLYNENNMTKKDGTLPDLVINNVHIAH